MIDFILILVASIAAAIAYLIYFFDLKKTGTVPSRYSWIVWSLSMTLESITYCQVSGYNFKSLFFIFSAACCIGITIKIWAYTNKRGPDTAEWYSLVFYFFFLITWPFIQSPFIAHLLLLIAIPFTFFPTYKGIVANFKKENYTAWLLWSISNLIIIVSISLKMETSAELPYAIMEFICNCCVVMIILLKRASLYKTLYHRNFEMKKYQ